MLRTTLIIALLFLAQHTSARPIKKFADSIRKAYHVPELAYAVVTADSVLELEVLGIRKAGTKLYARKEDRFRLGSNTKAVTGMIAAKLVKQGKLSWQTKFFDMFPEMKKGSRKEFHNLSLQDLLSFRTRIIRYTYTDPLPTKEQIKGDEAKQRYLFVQWAMQQAPVQSDGVSFCNPGYSAAGLMLEKASGKSYKQLVAELDEQLGISFGFGQPNQEDQQQVWGHNGSLRPEAPADNYKLNWLLPAGNLNLTMPDYAKYIQEQLKGLQGHSRILTAKEFNWLHYAIPRFSIGWFNRNEQPDGSVSWSDGNPGTFLSHAIVFGDKDLAFIILTNAQTEEAGHAIQLLDSRMRGEYLRGR